MTPKEKMMAEFFGPNYKPEQTTADMFAETARLLNESRTHFRHGLGATVSKPAVQTSMIAQVAPRGARDPYGRDADDPLWGLPHSKCSCDACRVWRERHAHKLGARP